MGKLLHQHNNFIIIEEDCGRGVVLINTAGKYENHGHLKTYKTAVMMINFIERRIVPKNDYLRCTALRVATDENYKENIRQKIAKDKNKQSFFNVNKGIMSK